MIFDFQTLSLYMLKVSISPARQISRLVTGG